MSADFILAPGETFIQCPYNTAHQITNARMLTHLGKCRKAYLNSLSVDGQQKVMRICKYNATHHVPDAELKFHEDRCPDATSVLKYVSHHNSAEGQKYYDERKKRQGKNQADPDCWDMDPDKLANIKVHPGEKRGRYEDEWTRPSPSSSSSTSANPPKDEDWEAEASGYQPGYDPKVKLKSETILYNPAGLTKSERKTFRNEVFVRNMLQKVTGEKVELPVVNENFKLCMTALPGTKPPAPEDDKSGIAKHPIENQDESNMSATSSSAGSAGGMAARPSGDSSAVSTSSASTGSSRRGDSAMDEGCHGRGQSRQQPTASAGNDGGEELFDWPWPAEPGEHDYDDDSDDFAGYDPYGDDPESVADW